MDGSTGSRDMSIGFVGTFDVNNYGDCLFPDVYRAELARRLPNATFTLYSPFSKAAEILSFDEVKALPTTLDQPEFDEDCLVLIGGETLGVGHSMGAHLVPANTPSHYLRMWLIPCIANGLGKTRFFIHSVGIPPTLSHLLGPASKILRSAERVSVRDEVSHERLKGVAAIEVDPVFLLRDMLPQTDWERTASDALPAGLEAGEYIACQISPIYALGSEEAWCREMVKLMRMTGKKLLMLPICHFLDDHEFLAYAKARIAAIAPELASEVICLEDDLRNVRATAALIAASAGYVGSSLHGAVTAAAFARPYAVFAGSGGSEGKHRQTLLSAGFDKGTAFTIDSIADCFQDCAGSDLEGSAAIARQRASEGLDALAEAILGAPVSTVPVDAQDIAEIAEFDRARITPRKKVRRAIRRIMRRLPIVKNTYRRYMFRRRFHG